MMRGALTRIVPISLAAMLLAGAYVRTSSSSVMVKAANAFLATLTPEQKAKATFAFDDAERMNWFFVPIERKGLQVREMQPYQKALAHALLAAGLSQTGYIKASTIMSLEDVLKTMEKDSGERRNPEKYYFSIFGAPDEKGSWGFRVEGHHLSQNFTVVNGKPMGGPTFFGSNPAEVREGPRSGLRVLAAEEDLGRAVIDSLDPAQRKLAVVDQTAPKDILTSNQRQAALKGDPSGIPAAKLNPTQFALLQNLVNDYIHNMPEDLAQYRMAQFQKVARNIHFAWAGAIEKGGPHYYRVQTPTFLIEYDNTQNGANHVHSVWRDLTGDFGQDLLKAHYQASHGD